ncbi:MAG: hypothetical protein FWE27_07030 [Defluviitaleaceae bacterium]|nr:hypothetical protein [Defluviitaleaceae bacterium]
MRHGETTTYHIDDQERVIIPEKLRRIVEWVKGDRIELIPIVDENILVAKLANNNPKAHEIDNLSRVKIPKEIRDILGWECMIKLELIVDENDKSIIMKIAA